MGEGNPLRFSFRLLSSLTELHRDSSHCIAHHHKSRCRDLAYFQEAICDGAWTAGAGQIGEGAISRVPVSEIGASASVDA